MRKIITSMLLALLFVISGSSMLTAQVVQEMYAPEAIYEDGSLGNHAVRSSGLLHYAGKNLDLENEDAVILFQRFEIRWTVDGRLVQTTRRSVLIRTEYGLDHFADLRIPWDSTRQKLTVERLRTLRLSEEATFSESTSIDAGPTAEVETLPFRVDRAPDYCHLRETMLLHDGIELPCILETIWTVEDTEPFRPGAAGTHSFMGTEPVMFSQFSFAGAGVEPVILTAGGAPQPTMAMNADGQQTWTIEMQRLASAPHPDTDESILQQPRVSWSTWKSWEALAADLEARVASGAVLDDEVREAFNEKLKDARTPGEKARLVAEFIDQTTRLIGLDDGWWPEPRPAFRTWATGYGHRVDRAVLAAALYREAGYTARLAFRSAGLGQADVSVPGLGWSDGVSLQVSGDGVDGWFDPGSARLEAGSHALIGGTVWIPGEDSKPTHQPANQPDLLTLRFDLAFDAEKQTWAGTGVLVSEGTINPIHRMSGLGTEALDFLGGFVGTFLDGAKVTTCNPERFDASGVTMGFALELPAGERDAHGRLKVEVAPFPASHFVDLHVVNRESDIHLPAPAALKLILKLDPGDLETVHLPASVQMQNAAGRWKVNAETGDEEKDGIILGRELELPASHFPAARWPELRALLLAGETRAGRVLLFK